MTAPRATLAGILILTLLVASLLVEARQARLYRVGVVFQGGGYAAGVEGRREGLRELGCGQGDVADGVGEIGGGKDGDDGTTDL